MTHSHKGMSRAEADATLGKLLYQKRGEKSSKEAETDHEGCRA